MSKPHRFAGRRVAVVMGGLSAEREVSLDTGAGVLAALLEHRWDAVAIDWTPGTSLAKLLEASGAAVVWNALHGTWGEDGAVQGLCACLQIPCSGSGILASALAMDKVMSKRIFESNSLPTPRWRVLPHEPSPGDAAALADWAVPYVVKPANEGSSVGVSIVDAPDQLEAALALARTFHGPVIVEEYIAGTELFVGILNDRVLGSVEVHPATRFYDYEAKYKRTDTRYLIRPSCQPPWCGARSRWRSRPIARSAAPAMRGPTCGSPPRASRSCSRSTRCRHDQDEPLAQDRQERRHGLPDPVRADPRDLHDDLMIW